MNDMTDRVDNTDDIVRSVAWPAALALAVIAGSLVTACMMPFVGLAVAAAATMRMRNAAVTVAAGWLANQILGFGLLGYPFSSYALSWGIALGLAAQIAAIVAACVIQAGGALVLTRAVVALAAAFVAYEAFLFVFAGFAGGRENFSIDIVSRLAVNDAAWCIGLLAFRLLLGNAAPGLFGRPQALKVV
ncbi:MAG: hypothetical protein DI543_17410 [Bradyrhizobium icense]|jgi:hypothetical protein|nr:MAG: hypothetical protein DI543_17410 [Bradyrhizobium icense]